MNFLFLFANLRLFGGTQDNDKPGYDAWQPYQLTEAAVVWETSDPIGDEQAAREALAEALPKAESVVTAGTLFLNSIMLLRVLVEIGFARSADRGEADRGGALGAPLLGAGPRVAGSE